MRYGGLIVYSSPFDIKMTIPWLSAAVAAVFYWIQLHPILASLCIVVIIYHVHAWLYPDPLMKLPAPTGARLYGGHTRYVVEWVSRGLNNTDYRLIDFSVLRLLLSFTRNTSES